MTEPRARIRANLGAVLIISQDIEIWENALAFANHAAAGLPPGEREQFGADLLRLEGELRASLNDPAGQMDALVRWAGWGRWQGYALA